MASWLQAQLKAAENLLEAVDRTVSATSGAPVAPPEKDSSTGDGSGEQQDTTAGSMSPVYEGT